MPKRAIAESRPFWKDPEYKIWHPLNILRKGKENKHSYVAIRYPDSIRNYLCKRRFWILTEQIDRCASIPYQSQNFDYLGSLHPYHCQCEINFKYGGDTYAVRWKPFERYEHTFKAEDATTIGIIEFRFNVLHKYYPVGATIHFHRPPLICRFYSNVDDEKNLLGTIVEMDFLTFDAPIGTYDFEIAVEEHFVDAKGYENFINMLQWDGKTIDPAIATVISSFCNPVLGNGSIFIKLE